MSTIKCYDTLKCMYVEVEVTEVLKSRMSMTYLDCTTRQS